MLFLVKIIFLLLLIRKFSSVVVSESCYTPAILSDSSPSNNWSSLPPNCLTYTSTSNSGSNPLSIGDSLVLVLASSEPVVSTSTSPQASDTVSPTGIVEPQRVVTRAMNGITKKKKLFSLTVMTRLL